MAQLGYDLVFRPLGLGQVSRASHFKVDSASPTAVPIPAIAVTMDPMVMPTATPVVVTNRHHRYYYDYR